MRRVVAGTDREGKSAIVSDERLVPDSAVSGFEIFALWGGDGAVVLPSDGARPAWNGLFPSLGGFRFTLITVPPDGAVADRAAGAQIQDATLAQAIDGDGWHMTDTVDLIAILSGEIMLQTETGETLLSTGDTFVNNGTLHAWRNRSSSPTVMVSAVIGARRLSI